MTRFPRSAMCAVLAVLFLSSSALPARGGEGSPSLRNPGFEEESLSAWQQRTPQDASRRFSRSKEAVHSGQWSMMLENLKPAFTRLRQGHDRSIALAPGSLVELSAWVKTELSEQGGATVQLYCMGDADKESILAQPQSTPIRGTRDWTRARVLVEVPAATSYVMTYLQIDKGIGKAFFDDVQLRVVRPPRPKEPSPRIGLLTDLPQDDPCRRNVAILLGDGQVLLKADTIAKQLAGCAGAVVLARSESIGVNELEAVARAAQQGKPVFMDLRSFARWRKLEAGPVPVSSPTGPAKPDRTVSPVTRQMAAGLRVVKDSPLTQGFRTGQIMPRAGAEGKLLALSRLPDDRDLEVLAVTPDGRPGLVALSYGKGTVVAVDVLSLREPYFSHVDGYYKYLFLSRALRLSPDSGFAEYYPKKLKYAQFVELMRQTAAELPGVRFQEEGPACGDYRIYSLNLGRTGAPRYFLYAATHGSEWEPGYGLLTLARHLAQGRLRDVVDLDKVAVKIVPLLNPSGYDLRQRQNANGVDLNRQGDFRWDAFRGTDSTKDGVYGPRDYDWKGASPLSEPETKTYQAIIQAANLHCVLEFHGNVSATSNRVAVLPVTAREDNFERVLDLQDRANRRLRGRWLLKQLDQKDFEHYLLEKVYLGGDIPYLVNTSTRGRYGLMVEVTAGYSDSYGTLLQTDFTCEICRALFLAFPIPSSVK